MAKGQEAEKRPLTVGECFLLGIPIYHFDRDAERLYQLHHEARDGLIGPYGPSKHMFQYVVDHDNGHYTLNTILAGQRTPVSRDIKGS